MARLLRRNPACRISLDNPFGVVMLLEGLREAGAEQQATALAEQLPGQACSGSSASKRTARIGSGSAGRLTAAPAWPCGWENLERRGDLLAVPEPGSAQGYLAILDRRDRLIASWAGFAACDVFVAPVPMRAWGADD